MSVGVLGGVTQTGLMLILVSCSLRKRNEPEWADSGPVIEKGKYREVCGMPGLMEMEDGTEVSACSHNHASLPLPLL